MRDICNVVINLAQVPGCLFIMKQIKYRTSQFSEGKNDTGIDKFIYTHNYYDRWLERMKNKTHAVYDTCSET